MRDRTERIGGMPDAERDALHAATEEGRQRRVARIVDEAPNAVGDWICRRLRENHPRLIAEAWRGIEHVARREAMAQEARNAREGTPD